MNERTAKKPGSTNKHWLALQNQPPEVDSLPHKRSQATLATTRCNHTTTRDSPLTTSSPETLLLYPSPNVLGGIETLIGRESRWLLKAGYRVTLLTTNCSKWRHALPHDLKIIEVSKAFENLGTRTGAQQLCDEIRLREPRFIHAFNVSAGWYAANIAEVFDSRPRVIIGLYNPRVFASRPSNFSGLRAWVFNDHLVRSISPQNRLYIHCEQRDAEHSLFHDRGNILPLPVDALPYKRINRTPVYGKIVSVSRLAPMKEYTLKLPQLAQKLRREGFDVTVKIFGEGPYRETLEEEIRNLSMEPFVEIPGVLPREKFASEMSSAWAFVGMGTAAVEASMCGVPTITAIAHNEHGETYGTLDKLPYGNFGVPNDQLPKTALENELRRILNLSPGEYNTTSEKCRIAGMRYDSEEIMPKIVSLLEEANDTHCWWLHRFAYWLSLTLSRFLHRMR
ncbi:glycosyltransferase family 4 protein [Rhodopirellula sp. SWK7]|uniref:glycosyltransferase family 4 protein n=1 Tax=Rhodopirellula sp. SWK7 TaxID=595460 RepID=UPI0002BFF900|nr:glycosyltransferase [Rhodopirellula sp. SWK7]EMI41661.1 hypothetical protein RRSWK_05833 [Rhodopirellula sp. SWK7]